MYTIVTILTAAAFSAHALLGCGCRYLHTHDAEAGHGPEQRASIGHHGGGHHHHSHAPHVAVQDEGDGHSPVEHHDCQCSHVGCVYVVGPKVKSTIDAGVLFALVEIAPTSAAGFSGPDIGRTALVVRNGPPPSLRSHLLLQILLV